MPQIRAFRDPTRVDTAFEELCGFRDRLLAGMQVETPDANMNRMLNTHNPWQCHITLNWSRYLSLYQLGFGARGIGFRDSSQDVMGVVALAPEEGVEVASVREGLELTLKMLCSALEKFGLEEVDPQGQPFDPEFHQAMSTQPSTEVEPDHVLLVYQKGYVLQGRLVRPAMVVVAKAAEGA